MESKKINVGGQAVVEGVMIRGPYKYSVAVRKGKTIVAKVWSLKKNKPYFYKWPFIRGFVNLAEMLVIGLKSLMWSAEQAAPKEGKISRNELAFTILVSMALVILFFIAMNSFVLCPVVLEQCFYFFHKRNCNDIN